MNQWITDHSRTIKVTIMAVFAAYCVATVIMAGANTKNGWDFRTYYYAAVADAGGENPYRIESLSKAAGETIEFPFLYPAVTLPFFRLFTLVDVHMAFLLFLALKLALLVAMVTLWCRYFLKQEWDWLFFPFCLLAFNGAIHKDLVTGNVTTIEQAVIWLGFYFFLEKRYAPFVGLMLVASFFKVTPIAFTGLLLFTQPRRAYGHFAAAIVLFAAFIGISYLINPVYFSDFLKGVAALDERSIINPSSLALIKDLLEALVVKRMGGTVAPWMYIVPYGTVVGLLAVLTLRRLMALREDGGERSELVMVLIVCLAYALALPRFKNYSYMLLIVPAYYLVRRAGALAPAVAMYLLAVAAVIDVQLPIVKMVYDALWQYYPLVVAAVLWIAYLVWRPEKATDSTPGS